MQMDAKVESELCALGCVTEKMRESGVTRPTQDHIGVVRDIFEEFKEVIVFLALVFAFLVLIATCLGSAICICRCYRGYKNRKYVAKVCEYLETKEGKVDRDVVMTNVKTLNEELTLDFVDQNFV